MRSHNVILSIIVILIFLVPVNGTGLENQHDLNSQVNPDAIRPDQANAPVKMDLNASISYVERNVTIRKTSEIILEDRITLQINNESSRIGTLNYTIPTSFDKYVQEATFWSNYGVEIGLDLSENERSYTKFVGKDATTYYIDIRINNTLANETDNTHILSRLVAVGAISFGSSDEEQHGRFITPVTPIFPNLNVEDGVLGMNLEATQDSFLMNNITKTSFANQDWPVNRNEGATLIEWRNMTRDAYTVNQDLVELYDYNTIFFESDTTASDDTQLTTIPYVYTSATRRLTIDPWGSVYISETITVLHRGASFPESPSSLDKDYGLTQIPILVSRDAVVTDVSDEFGSLNHRFRNDDFYPTTSIDTDLNKQKLTIQLRTAIYGGESYTITIKYQYDASDLIVRDGNKYSLNATLFSDFNTTVYSLRSIFKFPATAEMNSYNWVSQSRTSDVSVNTHIRRDTLNFFRHVELEFKISSASYVDNYEFQIEYTYSGYGHIGYVITFMLIFALILSATYALTFIRLGAKPAIDRTKETVPVDKIEAFYNLFSDRAGANMRISELREKRKKGKLSKIEYDGQIKALNRRVREINPQLDTAAKALSDIGAKYKSYVDKVMIASQKQLDIRANTDNAKKSYHKGDTPKNIYQKLIREYSRDLTKQENIINKNLAELAELIQEYS